MEDEDFTFKCKIKSSHCVETNVLGEIKARNIISGRPRKANGGSELIDEFRCAAKDVSLILDRDSNFFL